MKSQARAFVRDLVIALQASLLIRHSPQMIADAFCASRLGGGSAAFGMLPSTVERPPHRRPRRARVELSG